MRHLISAGSALLFVILLSSPAFAVPVFSEPSTQSTASVLSGLCVDIRNSSGASSALASCGTPTGDALVGGRATADTNFNLLKGTAFAFVEPLPPATASGSSSNAVANSFFDDFFPAPSSAFFWVATGRLTAVIRIEGNPSNEAIALETVELFGSGGDETCDMSLFASGSAECTVRIPVVPGERITLEMGMIPRVIVSSFGAASVDASGTGTITNLLFLDVNGNPLPGVITGESGTVYPSLGAPAPGPGPGPGPVPEPSTLLLLVSGVAGLAGLAWRRRRPKSPCASLAH